MSDDAFISGEKRDEAGRFVVPPVSPGRPKGARSKLGEAFVQDMLADWSENGVAVIQSVRTEDPVQYLKVVAGILPKEMNIKVSELDELTDEQLVRQLASIAAQLAASGISFGEGVGPQAPTQPTGGVSTLQ